MIEVLCTEHQIEFDWLKEEILKEFHEKKINNEDLDDKSIEKIIDKAIQQIN
jgi:hypothetical protein